MLQNKMFLSYLVFFRSGIVGELEEMRDERLSKIISQFQAYCKAHLMRIEYKKMKDRIVGLAVLQVGRLR